MSIGVGAAFKSYQQIRSTSGGKNCTRCEKRGNPSAAKPRCLEFVHRSESSLPEGRKRTRGSSLRGDAYASRAPLKAGSEVCILITVLGVVCFGM